jgi:hypothetical protein
LPLRNRKRTYLVSNTTYHMYAAKCNRPPLTCSFGPTRQSFALSASCMVTDASRTVALAHSTDDSAAALISRVLCQALNAPYFREMFPTTSRARGVLPATGSCIIHQCESHEVCATLTFFSVTANTVSTVARAATLSPRTNASQRYIQKGLASWKLRGLVEPHDIPS